MPTLRQATTGLLALTSVLVLIRSLSTMTGYNSRGVWRDGALTTAPHSTQAEVCILLQTAAARLYLLCLPISLSHPPYSIRSTNSTHSTHPTPPHYSVANAMSIERS